MQWTCVPRCLVAACTFNLAAWVAFLYSLDTFYFKVSHGFRIKQKCLWGKPVDVGPKEENPSEERVLEAGDGSFPLFFLVRTFLLWILEVFKRYSAALQEIFKECAPKYLPKEARKMQSWVCFVQRTFLNAAVLFSSLFHIIINSNHIYFLF